MGRHKKEEQSQLVSTDKIGFETYSGQGVTLEFVLREYNKIRESIERQKADLIKEGHDLNPLVCFCLL
jgi:hypothetical protein